jgi:hypothetical protein
MQNIKPAFSFPIAIWFAFAMSCSSILSFQEESQQSCYQYLVSVAAFLCLDVWQEPFPLASFAPFAGCNSLSAFTDIVKDWVAMFLGC